GAHRLVARALEITYQEPADELRKLELERLDTLSRALWPTATTDPPNLKAIDRLLKIMDRRAKLLGLDVTRVTVRSTAPGKGYIVETSPEDLWPPEDEGGLDKVVRALRYVPADRAPSKAPAADASGGGSPRPSGGGTGPDDAIQNCCISLHVPSPP